MYHLPARVKQVEVYTEDEHVCCRKLMEEVYQYKRPRIEMHSLIIQYGAL